MIRISGTGSYIFYQHEERYFISVLCGTVGLYEIELELSDEEKQEYLTRGDSFLEEFAQKVSNSPKTYAPRHFPLHRITGVPAQGEQPGSPGASPPSEST